MNYVKFLLKSKGDTVLSIEPSAPVAEALGKMAANNVGSLAVLRDGKLVGLVTERDIVRAGARRGKALFDDVVADVMVKEVLYVSPDTTLEDCMALMTEKRTRHLPVLEHGALVGLISIGDVVKRLIADRDFMIDQMERYIRGG